MNDIDFLPGFSLISSRNMIFIKIAVSATFRIFSGDWNKLTRHHGIPDSYGKIRIVVVQLARQLSYFPPTISAFFSLACPILNNKFFQLCGIQTPRSLRGSVA